jgi:hypothetical protein
MTFRWLTELRGLVLGRPGGNPSPWGGRRSPSAQSLAVACQLLPAEDIGGL